MDRSRRAGDLTPEDAPSAVPPSRGAHVPEWLRGAGIRHGAAGAKGLEAGGSPSAEEINMMPGRKGERAPILFP